MFTLRTSGIGLFVVGLILAGCGRRPAEKSPPKVEVVLGQGKKTETVGKGDPGKVAPGKVGEVPGQQTVTFLGAQGTGRRFCIIADCSKSLSPESFGRIKKEMVRTLRSLDENSSFHVMFFAGQARSMPGEAWAKGGKDVDRILPWIRKQDRVLGTIAAPAFARAFALKPPPDVIFFMTDGQIRGNDPEKVARMNDFLPKIPVHTILFVKEKFKLGKAIVAEMQLKQIARDAGGTFRLFRPGKK